MKVAVLGPEGTYTHQAAEEFFKNDVEMVFCRSIKEAMGYENSVIPFENSLAGSVGEAIDTFKRGGRFIKGEKVLGINHVLASVETDVSDIERVVSHPKALGQCRKIIDEKGWDEVEASSTAGAASDVGRNEAALCSRKAAKINGLNILEEDVQDREGNTTRFFLVGGNANWEGEKSSILLEPSDDRPGLLSNILSCFSGHGINLSYIQSRPTKEGLGKYFFYVEAESDFEDRKMVKAMKCVDTYCDVTRLGSY